MITTTSVVLGLLLLGLLGGGVFILTRLLRKEEPIAEVIEDGVCLKIAVPRNNEKDPLAAEQMFASLHGLLGGREFGYFPLSFEITSDVTGVKFFVYIPKELQKFVEGQVYAQYPDAEITMVEDYVTQLLIPRRPDLFFSATEIELAKDFIFPIKTFRSFEVDPLAAITGAMTKMGPGQYGWLQIMVSPVDNFWQQMSKDYVDAVREGKDPLARGPSGCTGAFWWVVSGFFGILGGFLASLISSTESEKEERKEAVRLAAGQEEELAQIETKMTKVGFESVIRIVGVSNIPEQAQMIRDEIVASCRQFTTAHLNSLIEIEEEIPVEELLEAYRMRYLPKEAVDIFNIEELASIFHLPNVSVETPNIAWARAKKLEPPLNLPTQDCNIFAITDYRTIHVPFGIQGDDRRKHMYVVGKTGTGKSTLLKNMIISDIMSGHGIGIIDPHGELVESLLNFIPSQRINDVVYINPADTEFPIALNLLELKDPAQKDLVADGIVNVFKKQFESWGPRLQYILHNSLLTLLSVQNTSLLGIPRLLLDPGYRSFILKQIKDPVLEKFWREEYAEMEKNRNLFTEAIAPIQNKVGRFIASPMMRNIVGQVTSTIDLEEIMNSRKILLVNLSHGRIGEENASLFGGMLITRLQSSAMRRVSIPEEQRSDFYLFVDEFQTFATDSFARILSEARKYRLDLTMAHQYIGQLSEEVQNAVFGNIGTICSYVVGPQDAAVLAKEFSPFVTEEDMIALDKHHMYVKLMIDGQISEPFSAISLDLRYAPNENREKVVDVSRERYGRPVEIVDDKIKRWTMQSYSSGGNLSRGRRSEAKAGGVKSKSKSKKEKGSGKKKGLSGEVEL